MTSSTSPRAARRRFPCATRFSGASATRRGKESRGSGSPRATGRARSRPPLGRVRAGAPPAARRPRRRRRSRGASRPRSRAGASPPRARAQGRQGAAGRERRAGAGRKPQPRVRFVRLRRRRDRATRRGGHPPRRGAAGRAEGRRTRDGASRAFGTRETRRPRGGPLGRFRLFGGCRIFFGRRRRRLFVVVESGGGGGRHRRRGGGGRRGRERRRGRDGARPRSARVLVHADGDQGQKTIVAAAMHALQGAPAVSLSLASLIAEGEGEATRGVVKALREPLRCASRAPSVVHLASLETWALEGVEAPAYETNLPPNEVVSEFGVAPSRLWDAFEQTVSSAEAGFGEDGCLIVLADTSVPPRSLPDRVARASSRRAPAPEAARTARARGCRDRTSDRVGARLAARARRCRARAARAVAPALAAAAARDARARRAAEADARAGRAGGRGAATRTRWRAKTPWRVGGGGAASSGARASRRVRTRLATPGARRALREGARRARRRAAIRRARGVLALPGRAVQAGAEGGFYSGKEPPSA